MDKTYDLNLGSWGPYNKEYAGILNIADKERGTTFNVELFPGYFRRSVMASTLLVDGGVKPWSANSSRTNFTYRYELEWKDKVYVDVNYNVSNDKRVDIKCNFVNHSEIEQSLNINLCASLQPIKECLGPVFLRYKPIIKPKLLGSTKKINALDYKDIKTSQTIASGGFYLGEGNEKNVSSIGSTALVGSYFYNENHFVSYNLNGEQISSFGVRYKAEKDLILKAIIDKKEFKLPLKKCDEFTYFGIEIPKISAYSLTFIPNGAVTLDSVCFGDNARCVEFETHPFNFEPKRTVCGVSDGVTDQPIISSYKECLKLYYESVNKTYIIKWDYPVSLIRRFYCDDIGNMLCYRAQDHVNHWWRGVGNSVYDNVLSSPIFLKPNEEKTITFTIFEDDEETPYVDNFEKPILEDNEYAFSNALTKANLYLNTVYPIYSRKTFIRHNTPGRFWNCLYTWDSGLIGVGLGSESFEGGFDNLTAYLTPIGDKHSPCIFAGSTVPTQVLLYKYLFDKYPTKREKLKEIYPSVKQIFDFYKGLSDELSFKTGLASAWKYNYNSGGWDDYPPQKYLALSNRKNGKENYQNTVPVITSTFTVLIAKILREIANYFGFENEYDEYIEKTALSIETNLWNDKTGYYSYLVHDDQGNAKEFLSYRDGSDYNLGFDGVYPIIAGVSSNDRRKRVIKNVKTGLLTKYGISAVDVRASYFSKTGYWNGSVWVPHGWILWNSLLDQGEIDLASDIAKAYLDKWAKEVNETYCLFEHFMLYSGRGAGYHNFSGLSSPMLDFYNAYYKGGNVSCGFETIIISNTENEIEYRTERDNAFLLIVTDKESFIVNGKERKAIKSFGKAKYLPIEKGNGKILIK
ncbi:MAG: hypothetical protein IKJ14_07495 [Clostridia bacterium]|nr:hypothetical protein [Clostridia bacterium]